MAEKNKKPASKKAKKEKKDKPEKKDTKPKEEKQETTEKVVVSKSSSDNKYKILTSTLSLIIKIALAAGVIYLLLIIFKNKTGKALTLDMLLGKQSILGGSNDGCRKAIAEDATEIQRGERFNDTQYGFGLLCLDGNGEITKSSNGKYIGTTIRDKITISEFNAYIEGQQGSDPICDVFRLRSCGNNADSDCFPIMATKKSVYKELTREYRDSQQNVVTAFYDDTPSVAVPSSEEGREVLQTKCDVAITAEGYKKFVQAT